MTTLTIKIPDTKTQDVSKYIAKVGGEIIKPKNTLTETEDEEDEVTHEAFFGENIKRLIRAFKK